MPNKFMIAKPKMKWTRLKRIIFGISPTLAELLDLKFEIKTEDRRFLENQIFDSINKKFGQSATILFVGLDRYNWHYPRMLKGKFYSIDLNPRNKRYGRKNLHTIGSATQLSLYYPSEKFDVVICNGLIGYGVDDLRIFDEMLKECSAVLKTGGSLIIGYNNTPEFLNFDLNSAINLQRFSPTIPDIVNVNSSTHEIETPHRHTFFFLKKK